MGDYLGIILYYLLLLIIFDYGGLYATFQSSEFILSIDNIILSFAFYYIDYV
jgi:hypothetical protein